MKRLLLLALPTLLLAPAHAAGDGCPPETCGVQSTALPGSPVVALRPQGAYAVYDVVTGNQRFSLPFATPSADGRVVWVTRNPRRATVLLRYDARTGRRAGAWTLAGRNLGVGAVSADGRRVALVGPAPSRRSALVVFDAATGRAQRVALQGNFQPEAVSRDGRRLFLIQYVRAGYRVRLYDVARRVLQPGQLKPRNEDEPMTGYPAYAIGAADGRWLLTLYVKPRQHESFVHALDLRRGVAYCLDLPGRGTSQDLGEWALALGLGGRTLYAANGALGLATSIDLGTLEAARPIRFVAPLGADQYVNSVMSPRGDLVYFGGLHGLWAWDLRANRVRGPYRPDHVGGIAFTPDGRRLTVITPGGRALWLDAATGRRT
jgi:hypothetical protein